MSLSPVKTTLPPRTAGASQPVVRAFSATDDSWRLAAPFGEHPSSDGQFVQVFGPTEAKKMAWNVRLFLATRVLHRKCIPIHIGHPDMDRKLFPDERKLGKVTAARVGQEGLEVQIAWNALGLENLEQGYWSFPSILWNGPKPPPGSRKLYPDRMVSIGMTNYPNIASVRAWSANANAARIAAREVAIMQAIRQGMISERLNRR